MAGTMEVRVLLVETRALVAAVAAEALVEIAKKLIGLHVALAVVVVGVVDLATAGDLEAAAEEEVLEAKMMMKRKKMAQALVVEALERKNAVDVGEVVVLRVVMMGKMGEVEAVDLELIVTIHVVNVERRGTLPESALRGVEVVVHVTRVVKRAILLESVPKGVVVLNQIQVSL